MELRQQLIAEQIELTQTALSVDADSAFLRFAHGLITGKSAHALDPEDIVDAGGDKQIDGVTVEESSGEADIWITQAKNTTSFSSNALIQMGNGLKWIFSRPRKELASLTNKALRDKAYEVRSVVTNLGPSNIRVHVHFVTKGDSSQLPKEFGQEIDALRKDFDNGSFQLFKLMPYGANDLVAQMNAEERATRRIDAEVKMRYDVNTPSLIKYHTQDFKGLVCTVSAQEIARIVNQDASGAIFDLNLRRFLGSGGAVNQDILATSTDVSKSYEFWFLNNGITIVCDSFDAVTDPDDAHVKLKNMQIVNGCQTAATLANAEKAGRLAHDVRVLVRIYETSDSTLVDRIVLTTNNQNRITSRDLRANHAVQLEMEKAFQIYGYCYERKARQYHGRSVPTGKILPNEFVGQCYLAVVLRNPADARARKYKIWGEQYDRVFGGTRVEPHLIATLLGRQAHAFLRKAAYRQSKDDVTRLLAKRGGFHIARIAARVWRGCDDWNQKTEEFEQQLRILETNAQALDSVYDQAFQRVEKVLSGNATYVADLDRALKSPGLDEMMEKELHGGAAGDGSPNKGAAPDRGRVGARRKCAASRRGRGR